MKIRIRTDASAAKGIASRRGLGKVRHIEVNQLWLQEKVNAGDIEVMKVKGEGNLADALTKPLDGPGTSKHLVLTKQEVVAGRHNLTPDFEAAEDEQGLMQEAPGTQAGAGLSVISELETMKAGSQLLDLL